MLAFELAIYMRMHTAGNAEDSLQNGSPMPEYDSDPCFPVVSAVCKAALGTHLDAKQTGDNIRKPMKIVSAYADALRSF
jgi:hypothetical protein